MSARQMALIGLVGLMPLPLVGCGSPEEMVRVTSPDQRVDAVWVRESGGGATVGFSYKLFIVPIGGIPTRGHERLLAGTSRISSSTLTTAHASALPRV